MGDWQRAAGRLVGVLAGLLSLASAQERTQPSSSLQLRLQVEAAADLVGAIDYYGVLYGRIGPRWPSHNPKLEELFALGARTQDGQQIAQLLSHQDAKVRTLALLLLFDREEPTWLPRIAALLDDDAATLPTRTAGSFTIIGDREFGARWIDSPCIVFEVARQCLEFYCADFSSSKLRDPLRRFDAYWRPRRERSHCASWLRVRMQRATGGSTPIRAHTSERLRQVRVAVDKLPSPDREYMLIALADPNIAGLDAFATVAERIAAAKKLGDETLLRALAGDFHSSDPDLPLMFHGRKRISNALHGFLLNPQHAVFAPSSAEAMLALGAREGEAGITDSECPTVSLTICAASLRPERATEWLTAALDYCGKRHHVVGQTLLLIALAQYGDAASERLIVEGFWQDDISHPFGVQMRQQLLDAIVTHGGVKAERLVGALLGHERFETATHTIVIVLNATVGKLLGDPPITGQAVRATTHPLGLNLLTRPDQWAAAHQKFPRETAVLLATIKRWRTAVRLGWRDR